MLLSRRLSLGNLSEMCRTLRHYLHAGLTLRDAFRAMSRKGRPAVRQVCDRISEGLEKGESLEDCLKQKEAVFPPLFVGLVVVGEHTGMLVEVFAELEKYYTLQLKLRRDFISRITWPVIQFVTATLVLAGMILILGLLARPGSTFDLLGLGLLGERSALIFLGTIYGTLAVLAVFFYVVRGVLRHGAFDQFLLRVPALGPCMEAIALARFCMAMRLTMDTAMPIGQALALSLRGTANNAFAARVKPVQQAIRRGDDLVEALGETRLFPEEFMAALTVGEESGQVPEVMRRLAEQYFEESGRRLSALSTVAAYGVWLLVAAMIVTAIFRIALTYINEINKLT